MITVPGRIQSIERAVAVLRLLGAAPQDLALQEIADSLELPKATTHGIVSTLRHLGLVRQDRATSRYRLDNEIQDVPGGGLDPNLLRSRSMNWADSLAANTGEAVLIGVPAPRGVEVIHHVFRPDGTPQTLRLGEIRPLHASALGKVMLAYTPWLRSQLRQTTLERYTSRTTVDREALLEEVRGIKTAGYSIDLGEYASDVGGIAAPIRRFGGRGVGAIAVYGATDRLFSTNGTPHREITERVAQAARAISDRIAEAQ